jgi:phage-related protein
MTIETVLRDSLNSTNVADSNGEVANIVDVVNEVANGMNRVARAITPNIPGCTDATGGHVASLTEAVMGMTSGLMAIASAIEDLANAVREHNNE